MTTLRGKKALILGASSGVGKAAAKQLSAEGARVTAVARSEGGLGALAREGAGIETVRGDVSDGTLVERLVRDLRPDVVVLTAGVQPKMAPIVEQTWETFSAPWSCDAKAAFHLVKAALSLPLDPGSVVVLVSSGAAINGSHLSGGYAGAKRMQWLLAGYAQQQANARKLGIRFLAVLPKQLIAGTTIAEKASDAYGSWSGISGGDFMKRFEVPLDADKVASAILGGARGEIADGVTAVAVTGSAVETLG